MKRQPITSLVVGGLLLVIAQAHAQTDPLPSWNEGLMLNGADGERGWIAPINETTGGISMVERWRASP